LLTKLKLPTATASDQFASLTMSSRLSASFTHLTVRFLEIRNPINPAY
jgi:hypothetical protein